MSGFSFLAKESEILLYAGVLGLELGLIYDFFRIIRRVFRCGFFATACMDLAFWLFTAGRTFYIMHTRSNGTLRWFAVLGVLTILFLYMKWFSLHIVKIGVFVLRQVKWVLGWMKKLLTNALKMSIIKAGKQSKRGNMHGKESSISDEIS